MTALSATENDRIAMGGNNPPVFDAHKANIDDLRSEAGAWLDGAQVTTPEEAEGIDLLIKMARSARDEANKARLAEKKPHDDAGKAVQAKWTPLVDSAQRILDVCLEKIEAWRIAEKARKDAEAARIRAEAEAEREAEVAATRAAAGSIEAREQADQLAVSAKSADKLARAAEKAAGTKNGLRRVVRAEITDFAAAARHYWAPERERFQDLVQEFATRDARAGKRDIPGITVHEEMKAV